MTSNTRVGGRRRMREKETRDGEKLEEFSRYFSREVAHIPSNLYHMLTCVSWRALNDACRRCEKFSGGLSREIAFSLKFVQETFVSM